MVREGAGPSVELAPVIGCHMRVWCEVRFAGCGCSSREVEEKPVTGLFVQPYEHAAMAG